MVFTWVSGWSPPPYIIFASTSRPPDITHVINKTRPSPFFVLFHLVVLYWIHTKELTGGGLGTRLHADHVTLCLWATHAQVLTHMMEHLSCLLYWSLLAVNTPLPGLSCIVIPCMPNTCRLGRSKILSLHPLPWIFLFPRTRLQVKLDRVCLRYHMHMHADY